MSVHRRLARAPVTEALIDLRAVPQKGLDPDVLKSIPGRVKDRLPRAEYRRATEAQLELASGKPLHAMTRDLGLTGVWARTDDDREVAQFRIDGFTFSRLSPYTSWEDILPKALEFWKVYVEVFRPDAVTRIAVRYINHLPLPEGAFDLDEFVVTGPRIPAGVPDSLGQFSSRILLDHPELKLSALVTQSLETGVRRAGHTLLLDIEAFKVGDIPVTEAALTPHLESLRGYKNQLFFGSLTDTFARAFE